MMGTYIRGAVRLFIKNPWFSVVALLTLALGIGVNSALFSVVKAVLLEDLPYGRPAQLVRVWVTNPTQGFDRDVTSFPRFQDWKTRSQTMTDFAAFTLGRLILIGNSEPVQLRGAHVSANFLRVMGVSPTVGRDFNPGDDEEGRPRVVMLSHGLWVRSFAASPDLVGRRINLSGNEFTVAGVLPENFQFPERELDYWTPLILDQSRRQSRGTFFLNVVGRLRDGVNLAQAQAEMNGIAKALESEYVIDRNLGVALVGLKDDLTGPLRPALLVLAGAVTGILLICCANIAGILAAAAASRERELAIRAALGANRGRIFAQILSEAVTLFVAGGALGVAAAYTGIRLLLRFAPPELPQLQDTHLDLTMVAFTFVVSAVCGLIFGLRPAFQATRSDTVESLKAGTRGVAGRIDSRRFRTLLAAGQIALAMVLLSGASLMIRSFLRLQHIDPGFDSRNVFVAPIQLPAATYKEDRQAVDFYSALLERLRSVSGIESAGTISTFLLGRLPDSNIFTIEGRRQTIFTPLTVDVVAPEIFSTLKIPLRSGRLFDSRDRAGSLPVAMINESTARSYWPNADPVGQRFTYGKPAPDSIWYTVIGVVADTRRAGPDRPPFTESYLPMAQQPERMMQLVVRSRLTADETNTTLRTAVRELDRNQPLAGFATLDTAMGRRTAWRRFVMFLLSLFAATAVAIAGVGIYGLIAFLVAQRRQEFGLRVALGAKPRDLVQLVARYIAVVAGGGLLVGGVGAAVFSRMLESLLFGIGRLDPASYGAAIAGVILTCLLSTVVPLIAALRISPVIALREN